MAPSMYQTKDTILPISNKDYFKDQQCPMRTGNTRCRCKSTSDRVDFGDQAAPEKALMLRDQLLQQVKPSKNEASMPDSHVWNDIEIKVGMLMRWVLCKKHMSHCSAAVQMTMRFLKQESGMFFEEQGVHLQEPAKTNSISPLSELGSAAPHSTYASAASHLATPPMSPGTLTPKKASQGIAGLFRDGAISNTSFNPRQQSPFIFHMDVPVKTENGNTIHDIHSQRASNNTTPRAASNNEASPGTKLNKKERAPYGFHVRPRSRMRQAAGIDSAGTDSARQPQNEANKEEPPFGFTVCPRPGTSTQNSLPKKPQSPFEFTGSARIAAHAPVAQPCGSDASYKPIFARGKHRDSFDVADQNHSIQQPQSEMDELVERLKAADIRNRQLTKEYEREKDKLEDRLERLQDDNAMLLVANKQLLDAKRHYKELYLDARDRLVELEDAKDGWEDQLDESREHITKLEEELALLRRTAGR